MIEQIQLAKKGNEKAIMDIVDSYDNMNKKMANNVIKGTPYSMREDIFEDLSQEGRYGIIRAIEGFNPNKGAVFSTYVFYVIRTCHSAFIKSNIRNEEIKSLYSLEEEGVDNEDTESGRMAAVIRKEISTLPLLEQDVIIKSYGLDKEKYTSDQIGKVWGTSGSYVRKIKKQALDKLKYKMKDSKK